MSFQKNIILIAAVAENGIIGADNDLIWSLPDDLKRFVKLTKGNTVLMGRRTFDSLYIKPLPKRKNIVITRNESFLFEHPDVFILNDLESAFSKFSEEETIYVIGGGEIYKQTLLYATQLEITHVHKEYEGDTFFPNIDPECWNKIEEEHHPADEKHSDSFTFATYQRK